MVKWMRVSGGITMYVTALLLVFMSVPPSPFVWFVCGLVGGFLLVGGTDSPVHLLIVLLTILLLVTFSTVRTEAGNASAAALPATSQVPL